MKEEKEKFKKSKINVSNLIGLLASILSLAGGIYFIAHQYHWGFAIPYAAMMETSRIYSISEFHSGAKSSMLLYVPVALIILAVNIAGFDYWSQNKRLESSGDIIKEISKAINKDFDTQIQEVKNEYRTKIEAKEKHAEQNTAIAIVGGRDKYSDLAEERKTEAKGFKSEMRFGIQDLKKKRATALSERLTGEKIGYYCKLYDLNFDTSQIPFYDIYGIADSVGGKIFAIIIAVVLEILIFRSFYKGLSQSDNQESQSDKTPGKSDSENHKVTIQGICDNPEMIKRLALIFTVGGQNELNPNLRGLYKKIRQEVKNAKKMVNS